MDKTLLSFTKSDVFTPDKISYKMSSYLFNNGNLLEPAVGDGQLLKFLDLTDYDQIEIFDIKKEYLEICPNGKNIMKYNKDFLKKEIKTKYKNIILNPPFIRIQIRRLACDSAINTYAVCLAIGIRGNRIEGRIWLD